MPSADPLRAGPALQDWQSALQSCILDPRQDRAWLRERLHGAAVAVDTQLDIYANAYVLRLVEALRCNYPALHQALGDADFDAMAARFLGRHPSRHASIRWFGASLAAFLRATPPWREVPVLGELAEFEWALRHTIDAGDAARCSVQTLLSVPIEAWAGLRFDLHPSVVRLSLHWNTPQLWRALTETTPAASATTPLQQTHPLHWLVYRQPDLATGWYSLSAMENDVLSRLQRGESFADLCSCIAGYTNEDAALQAASLLRRWVEGGLLIDRTPAPEAALTEGDRQA